MSQDQVKLNKLGKPIQRVNGRFAKGNQEGLIFGKDKPALGRPPGHRNIMTTIKEIAMEKSSADGLSNIEFVVFSMMSTTRKLFKTLEKLDPDHPAYMKSLADYTFLSAKLMEHIAKYSGDYTQKIQAEVSEALSLEEEELMERMIKKTK